MLNKKISEKKYQQGFTLVEMLLALVIFSMFSISAYAILQGVLKSDGIVKQKISRLMELQSTMSGLEQDLTQIVARTWRQKGRSLNVVLYQGNDEDDCDCNIFMFVRAGWENPLGLLRRSELKKVAYRLKDGNLERLYWNYPDTMTNMDVQKTTLLTHVSAFQVRFYQNGQWLTQWNNEKELPSAIEFSITLLDYSEIHRRFLLANGASSS